MLDFPFNPTIETNCITFVVEPMSTPNSKS